VSDEKSIMNALKL